MKTVTARPGEVTGRVRLTVPTTAVQLVLSPLLISFVREHPGVEVDVRAENRFVDIVEEGLDAGVRLTEAIDRDMVQLRLTPPGRFVVVGSPRYLERKGTPQKVEDLLHHDCIGIRSTTDGQLYAWELERGKRNWRVPVRGPVSTNDPSLMVDLAVAGVGLMYTYEASVAEALRRGTLRVVLEPFAAAVPGFFLYFPSRQQVSPAFRAFVDAARAFATRKARAAHAGE